MGEHGEATKFSIEAAAEVFLEESRDMLQQMESCLQRLEADPANADALNALFRAAHTIKGSAGLFGHERVVSFTHVVESVLDAMRGGRLSFDAAASALLVECRDHIEGLLHENGGVSTERESVLRARLEALLRGGTRAGDEWHISLRFQRDALRNGFEPASVIGYLETLGEVRHLVVLTDAMPGFAEMDPEACYLGFELRLKSPAERGQIESAFKFVRDDCSVRILPPDSRTADYIALIEQLPEERTRLGEILVACGALTKGELEAALATQGRALLGEALVGEGLVKAPVVDAALDKQTRARERRSDDGRFIRVAADRLDRLIDLVGELVIAGAGVNALAREGRGELQEAAAGVSALVEEIRNGALQLRMVQIGETFARFRRVARELGRELGKEIDLVIEGGETELDKSVVERIADPLMHLVRNAVDHGIESPGARRAAGKPARGTLRLAARHDSGAIVIEVSDDGRGIDPERILAKAHAAGLVAAGATLTEAEILDLIFAPGFSTAETVTNVSGRGVGMDAVRKSIEALRGSVAVASRRGAGATMSIRLPLTLAIIDGFMVAVGGATFVVPLDQMIECVELPPAARGGAHRHFDLRGEVLPYIRLRELFEIEGAPPKRESVVVVRCGARKAGLVVDSLVGEQQTVIKPLCSLFRQLRGIAGSTVLGTGEVALILDVAALVKLVSGNQRFAKGEQ